MFHATVEWRTVPWCASVLAIGGGLACAQGDRGEQFGVGLAVGTAGEEQGADRADDATTADDDGSGAGPDTGDSSQPKLDVGTGETTASGDGGSAEGEVDGGGEGTCTKIDLLFVIDGSISMDVAQDKLTAAADTFIDAIEAQLVDAADYHIGVITTTEYTHNRRGCTAPGSLVTQTGGPGSSDAQCGPFASGDPWVGTGDALQESLSCTLGIGLGNGNVELTAEAILAAVTGDGPGGCNAGFVRSDALLAVVIVTDTDDPSAYPPGQGSEGAPEDWFSAVAAIKGTESNVVMISVLPPPNPSCTVEGNWSPLLPGTLDAPRLDAFTRMFTHHAVGDVCAADYGVVLDEALAVIEAGCDTFEPEG